MLVGNASIAAADIGEWAWAVRELDAGSSARPAEEERITLLGFKAAVPRRAGQGCRGRADACEAWYELALADEPFLEAPPRVRRRRPGQARRDFAGALASLDRDGRLDAYNAVSTFGDAVFRALLGS